MRVEIPQRQRICQAELDPGDAVRDLTGHELQATARRLMIEENPRNRKEVVAFTIVNRDVVRENLRHTIGAARIERRPLVLRGFTHLAKHLARGGLDRYESLGQPGERPPAPG